MDCDRCHLPILVSLFPSPRIEEKAAVEVASFENVMVVFVRCGKDSVDFRLALHKFDWSKNLFVHLLVLKNITRLKIFYVCF